MDTRLRKYSHSFLIKLLLFILVVLCFTGSVAAFASVLVFPDRSPGILLEKSYLDSSRHWLERQDISGLVALRLGRYSSEEAVLKGDTLSEDNLRSMEQELFYEFQTRSRSYNPNLSEAENYLKFKEEYAGGISEARNRLIRDELEYYHSIIERLSEYKGVYYYATDGINEISNCSRKDREYFKTFPSYVLIDKYGEKVYPEGKGINRLGYLNALNISGADPRTTVIYISFTGQYLEPGIRQWEKDRKEVREGCLKIAVLLAVMLLAFSGLVFVLGRKAYKDNELHLNMVDRIYNDINLGLSLLFTGIWVAVLSELDVYELRWLIAPVTALYAVLLLQLVLALIKHIKNRTLLRHTLLFTILKKAYHAVMAIYRSGSTAVKIAVILVGYPVAIAITFFMFPVTIGFAIWLALKRVREFNAIKEGVSKIRNGDLHHKILISGKGEFAKLAENINTIAEGLKAAVDSELKSERLKTELITNVSHDIRTPLTSIITYVDLLKKERDEEKAAGYLEVLERKSQRLKTLTDDLFEAAKASSGSMPVELEKIDIVSLITQGIGELNDKIEASGLKFRINHPEEKLYVAADGKLLWRAMENLLSNIFKYALEGSRVYIDIEDQISEVKVTVKNISASELNVAADELMERFTRGDQARSSQGSGLGLSIAKSLIDLQKGRFNIEIDGDLFKAIVYLPDYR